MNKKITSLQTQYSRLIKPLPSGSGCAAKTSHQKWLVEKLDFLKQLMKKQNSMCNWITTSCLQLSACSECLIWLNSTIEILKMFRTQWMTKTEGFLSISVFFSRRVCREPYSLWPLLWSDSTQLNCQLSSVESDRLLWTRLYCLVNSLAASVICTDAAQSGHLSFFHGIPFLIIEHSHVQNQTPVFGRDCLTLWVWKIVIQ